MNKKVFDLITFGETMVLFSPDTKGPLRYIHNFSKGIAGAESNVAIALARLGHKTGWFSKIGDDEFGRYIETFIRGEGVDVSRVLKDSENPTGLIFKERFAHVNPNIYYYRRNSAASALKTENIDFDYISKTKVLHITGITLAISQSAREAVLAAVNFAKDNGVKVSFDPNIRMKLWDIEEARGTYLELCQKADILFPGIDEAEILIQTTDSDQIVQKFHDMGVEIVALKLGKEGCLVSNSITKERHFVPGYEVAKVEDSVGAGDGFAAGFLCALFDGESLLECGQYANGVGAMATLVKGDVEGFPTKDQLFEFINKKTYIDR